MSGIAAVLRAEPDPADGGGLARLSGARRRRGPGGTELVLDGRLDNGPEIRALLVQHGAADPGEDDAAVVEAALARWGAAEGAARLLGDFAFALWDPRERTLLAGRDALGVKPLFHASTPGGTFLASEPAALLEAAGIPGEPDEGFVGELLAGAPADREKTPFRGIRRLLPGQLLRVGPEGSRSAPFREPDPGRASLPPDAEGAVEAFRAILLEAIRCRLRSDRPAAISLSGGLDSSSVALLAAELLREGRAGTPGLLAFTVSFPGLPCDETELARSVAGAAGIGHEVIPFEEVGEEAVEEEVRRTRLPPDSAPSLSLAGLARRLAARGVGAILDGEGGDEVFAPSPERVADHIAAGSVANAIREARSWGDGTGRGTLRVLAEAGVRPLLPGPLRAAARAVRGPGRGVPWIDPAFARRIGLADRLRAPPSRRLGGEFARGWRLEAFRGAPMLGSLEHLDRWGVRCGGEARHPFLDLRVVEAALALPERLRADGARGKVALRAAVGDLLPAAVRDRTDKAEFSGLCLRALRTTGFLDDPRVPRLAAAGWVREEEVLRMTAVLRDRCAAGAPADGASLVALWDLYGLETWARVALGTTAA